MIHQTHVVFLTPKAKAGFKASGNHFTRAYVDKADKGIIQEVFESGLMSVKFQRTDLGYITLTVSPDEVTFQPACPTCQGTGHSRGAYSSYKTCLDCAGYGYVGIEEAAA